MILQNINFGNVWSASGGLGFFGEGYWFHGLPWLNTTGMTFAAKTVTTEAIAGNMPLHPHTWEPITWIPGCIWANPWRGAALNAVGLSNFGIEAALRTGRWQALTKPFQLSWMPMPGLKTKEERLSDARAFASKLKAELRNFTAPIALQINISCPNTDEDLTELLDEAAEYIKIFKGELGVPILPKINVLTRPAQVAAIYEREPFDAVVVSNTLPFGEQVGDRVVLWENITGPTSPLEKRGFPSGGLSGKPLYPLVKDWIIEAINQGFEIPINWCGGIMNVPDARTAMASDLVQSISLGTMLMLRPWRVQSTIRELA